MSGNVKIFDRIANVNALDGIVEDAEFVGGFRRVQSLTDRDNITTLRRLVGMQVYVVDTDLVYKLVGGTGNGNWVVVSQGLTTLTYQPGGTASSGVYVDQTSFMAACAAVKGAKILYFDYAFAGGDGSIHVTATGMPVGGWKLGRLASVTGSPHDLIAFPGKRIVFEEGAKIDPTEFPLIYDTIQLTNVSTQPVCTTTEQVYMLFHQTNLFCSGAPFLKTSSGPGIQLFMYEASYLTTFGGLEYCFESAGGDVNVSCRDFAALEAHTLKATGGGSIFVDVASDTLALQFVSTQQSPVAILTSLNPTSPFYFPSFTFPTFAELDANIKAADRHILVKATANVTVTSGVHDWGTSAVDVISDEIDKFYTWTTTTGATLVGTGLFHPLRRLGVSLVHVSNAAPFISGTDKAVQIIVGAERGSPGYYAGVQRIGSQPVWSLGGESDISIILIGQGSLGGGTVTGVGVDTFVTVTGSGDQPVVAANAISTASGNIGFVINTPSANFSLTQSSDPSVTVRPVAKNVGYSDVTQKPVLTAATTQEAFDKLKLRSVAQETWRELLITDLQMSFPNGFGQHGIGQGILCYISTNPSNNDTFVINDGTVVETFVFKTSAVNPFEVQIGGTAAETEDNLRIQIETDSASYEAAILTGMGRYFIANPNHQLVLIRVFVTSPPARVYGTLATPTSIKVRDFATQGFDGYGTDAGSETNLPAVDPGARRFGFARAFAALIPNEIHPSANEGTFYQWDATTQLWEVPPLSFNSITAAFATSSEFLWQGGVDSDLTPLPRAWRTYRRSKTWSLGSSTTVYNFSPPINSVSGKHFITVTAKRTGGTPQGQLWRWKDGSFRQNSSGSALTTLNAFATDHAASNEGTASVALTVVGGTIAVEITGVSSQTWVFGVVHEVENEIVAA